MIAHMPSFRSVRGAVAPMRLILLVVVAIVVVVVAWWFYGNRRGAVVVPVQTPGKTPSVAQAPPPQPVPQLSVDQLYQQARTAMAENRMAGPAGNNALEYYLQILAREPDNSGAQDALRELFPFATGAAEDQINQGNFDEANRIIDLLAKADPSNYSLTILRSKIDAKKRLDAREQAQALAAEAAAAAKAQAPAEPAQQPAPTPPPAAPPTPVATTPPATAAPPPAVAEPEPAVVTGETRDAEPIKAPAPQYPVAAVRNHQQGWVEVEFTVATDGTVQNARVVDSVPAHVFDQAALRAVEQATYRPRLDNGKPAASVLRRRIEFKLGG